MNATVRDQGNTHQAANNQYITNNNYYSDAGSAAGSAAPAASRRSEGTGDDVAREGWFRGHRKEWIGFVGVVAAASITAAGGYMAASNDGSSGAGSTPAPVASAPAVGSRSGEGSENGSAPTTSSGNEGANQSTSAQSASPAVQWHGTLVFDGGGKDLDGGQPIDATGNNDVSTSGISESSYQLNALSGGSVSLWDAGREPPDYADCAGTADAAGTSSAPLKVGAVLCVKTGDGRIGRLKVMAFPEDYGPVVKFDAIVWSLATDAAADG